jgi:hypothetical protein
MFSSTSGSLNAFQGRNHSHPALDVSLAALHSCMHPLTSFLPDTLVPGRKFPHPMSFASSCRLTGFCWSSVHLVGCTPVLASLPSFNVVPEHASLSPLKSIKSADLALNLRPSRLPCSTAQRPFRRTNGWLESHLDLESFFVVALPFANMRYLLKRFLRKVSCAYLLVLSLYHTTISVFPI